MKRNIVRKGFTLVELLIVIVVIGILATMMMLSSTEAVTSAKASNVVSNLRNLKTAALEFYANHQDAFSLVPGTKIDNLTTSNNTSKDEIFACLGNGQSIPDSGDYSFNNFNGAWFVYYDVKSTHNPEAEQKKILQKLKGRAQSLGLFATIGNTTAPTNANNLATYKDTDSVKYVAMQIR